MADHRATITWDAAVPAAEFAKGKYSRAHTWAFDGGVVVPASSSPSVVPLPWSNKDNVDPEEAYVASIASCHMLTFLYVAAKAGFTVTGYRDTAVGVMTKNARGVPWISKVTLSPQITWADQVPDAERLATLHHAAHEGCFIAQSVNTEIVVA